jgi:hypothetical protein
MDEYKQQVMGAAPFKGDSLELLRAVYRGDYLATHDQIYAAGQCLRFEHPPAITVDGRSLEKIREQVRLEFCGGGTDAGDALIASIERRLAVSKRPHIPAPEVAAPGPVPAKHKPRPPGIDGERGEERQSATQAAAPQPERANGEPAAAGGLLPEPVDMVPTRGPGGRIRWVPR